MDRLVAMTTFLEIVDTGSMTSASRRLGVPLATVSRRLQELEAYLGTRLLTRSTRRLSLTAVGADYASACRRILEQVSDSEQTASREFGAPRGKLVITAPLAFGRTHLLPVMTEFLGAFPEINVRLILSDRYIHLLDEHIDLALRIGLLPDSSMKAIRVGVVRRVVCGSPEYFAQFGVPDVPQDLAHHACITFDVLGPPHLWSFGFKKRRARSVAVRSRMSVNTAEAALDAAVAGLGVTQLVSYQAERSLRAGELLRVLEPFEPAPVPVNLLYPSQGTLPLKLRSLLDFVTPRLRDRLKTI